MNRYPDISVEELLAQATCAVLIDGEVKGTAWLFSDRGHLLTAGHVFEHSDCVEVRFAEDAPRTAYRIQRSYDRESGVDYAILKLAPPLPDRCPLPIALAEQVAGEFVLLGYGKTLRDRGTGRGTFAGFFDPQNFAGNRLFKLDSKESGEPGYSGGAVFSLQAKAVVAIQIEATTARTGAERDTVLAMPIYRIHELRRILQPVTDTGGEQRRVDAAAPSHAQVGETIDLLVQVRFPDSPLLGTEDWPTEHAPPSVVQASEAVSLPFPVDPQTGDLGPSQVTIRVVTSDFAVAGDRYRTIEVPPDGYSSRISFLLTANRAGRGRINVEVYVREEVCLGSIPLEIERASVPSTASPITVVLFVPIQAAGPVPPSSTPQPQSGRRLPVGERVALITAVLGLVGVLGAALIRIAPDLVQLRRPPTPTPVMTLLEDFEAVYQMDWWHTDPVFQLDLTNSRAYKGAYSLQVTYAKTDTYQFIAAELPTGLRDLGARSEVLVWVQGDVTLLVKFEDENLRQAEVCTASAAGSQSWTLISCDYTALEHEIDLGHIKNVFFFPAPGDPTAQGTFYMDEVTLAGEP